MYVDGFSADWLAPCESFIMLFSINDTERITFIFCRPGLPLLYYKVFAVYVDNGNMERRRDVLDRKLLEEKKQGPRAKADDNNYIKTLKRNKRD